MPSLSGGVQGRAPFDFCAMTATRHATATPTDPLVTGPEFSSAPSARRWFIFVAIAVAVVLVAHLLDEPAWRLLRDPRVYERDWGRLLRSMGYLPTWLIVAIGLWTHDRPSAGWAKRGGYVILSPILGGALAELLKLLVRRLRPDADVFAYNFRAFSDHPFSTGGLGMPSSHTLVAFAGAVALARLFPRAWVLWYLLALGCALTRVMANAHFLSDTAAAAVLGWGVGQLLAQRFRIVA